MLIARLRTLHGEVSCAIFTSNGNACAAVPPKVLHYGLDWKIGKTNYEFDKHWFYDFDALMCPPWNLSDRSKGGLFKHPPHPSLYPSKVQPRLPNSPFVLHPCRYAGWQ